MANTYLTRTQVAGNRQIFTQSFWCKISDKSGTHSLAGAFNDSNNYNYCFIDGEKLKLQWKQSGSVTATLDTNRKFRDPNAFYNIVYAVDTTQTTASNRIKLYINGVQETSFSTATYPSLNRYTEVNDNGTTYNIGSASSGQNFNGIMSYVAFVDGTQELPGIFGETDSTTGEWKIKTTITPSVAWGTNGFLILKNGNSLTDQSSNSNNFTVGGGTLTNTEDCPDNVFATFNALNNNSTLTNGNLTATTDNAQKFGSSSTLGVSSGKFYWEMKVNATYLYTGVDYNPAEALRNNDPIRSHGWCYNADGSVYNNGSGSSFGNTFTTGDIIGVALDATNSKLYFAKNGVWQNSGNPESGSTGTGAVSITANETYFAVMGDGGSSVSSGASANFGNGFFGTTAVTTNSGNGYAGAEGASKFNYDPPNLYSALNTKGLNL